MTSIIDWTLAAGGLALLPYAVRIYIVECKGRGFAGMGGEMSFGFYWSLGTVLSFLGILPMLGISRWWSVAGYLAGWGVAIPLREIVRRALAVPCAPQSTGFQRFIRKTEKKAPGNDAGKKGGHHGGRMDA